MEIEKYVKDGQVAVLISPGFGAGWSTWASAHRDFMLFDKGLVDLALQETTNWEKIEREQGRAGLAQFKSNADEAAAYIKQKLGEEVYIYMGGWRDITVEWLPVGTQFTVEEYDGSESLRLVEDLTITA